MATRIHHCIQLVRSQRFAIQATAARPIPIPIATAALTRDGAVNACHSDGAMRALVVVTLAGMDEALHLGAPDGPALQLGDPPYPLDGE